MATELNLTAKTATTATLAVTNIPAGGTVEIQVADNPDFRGLATWRAYAASPAVITGLNQRGRFYARARGISAGGVKEAWGKTIGFYTDAGAARVTAPAAVMVEPAILVIPEPILNFSYNYGGLGGFPPTNMLRDDPSLIWAGSSPDGFAFTFEHAGGPVDTLALLDTTLDEGQTINVYAGDVLADVQGQVGTLQGNMKRASANMPQRAGYHAMMRLAAPVSARFWKIVIPQGGQQGMMLIRYLVLGLARTAKNISTDKVENPLDLGSLERSRDGTADRVFGHRMRKVDFEISMLTEMQWETQFGDLWRKIGLNEPVLVVPNSKAGGFLHDRILYGTLAQARATNHMAPRFSQAFSVESLI